jgi:hypothetical protein
MVDARRRKCLASDAKQRRTIMYRIYVTLVLLALLIPVAGFDLAASGAGEQQAKEEAKED